MALQGSLRDFSATEILQLIGMQQKTGCLLLEHASERVLLFVHEGRIVSTRLPGMAADDTLLKFLLDIHRLSEEQHRGIASIQRESGRDLEDILVNGRYLDADELAGYLDRQILDDITRVVGWDTGNYRFETDQRWTLPMHVRLSVEGALIEAARRMDEAKRSAELFGDPDALLGVRDLPDPDEPLAEEERELFGIIDGRHTLAEVIQAAPLTHSEACEALDRMLQSNWIEFTGRRESAAHTVTVILPEAAPVRAPIVRASFARELLLAVTVIVLAVGVHESGRLLRSRLEVRQDDVFVTSQLRDLRYTLELFKRERGRYPATMEDLVADRWVKPAQLQVPGHELIYHLSGTGSGYVLSLEREP